jgi:hypothetical protein
MLDARAKRIVWAFLLGVCALEGWGLLASFQGRGGILQALARYAFFPAATPLAWMIAALIAAVYVAYAAATSPFIGAHLLRPQRWRSFAALRAAALPMAIISGFFEEAFFRKMLMDVALHHGAGVAAQIALSALAFGAVHAIWGLMSGSLRGAFGAMLATGVLGAALAMLYVAGGRSVGPCIAAHTAINLLLEPWLIIAAATQRPAATAGDRSTTYSAAPTAVP